jgi:uncharacterized protein YacL
MFFAYEAIFITFVAPKSTAGLVKISERIKEALHDAESNSAKTNSASVKIKALKSANRCAKYFPIINNLLRKITIISLILGIPLSLLVYYFYHMNLIKVNNNFLVWVTFIFFTYMFMKLFYYTFQFLKNKKVIEKINLLFENTGKNEAIAKEILDNCNRPEET